MNKRNIIKIISLILITAITFTSVDVGGYAYFRAADAETIDENITNNINAEVETEDNDDVYDDINDGYIDVIKNNTADENEEDRIHMTSSISLPDSYDSRDYNNITPVKNQGSYGSCWAFAAAATLEAGCLSAGIYEGDKLTASHNLDFSERAITYNFYHRNGIDDPLGNTLGDYTEKANKLWYDGGNDMMAAWTLVSWEGAPFEDETNCYSDMPNPIEAKDYFRSDVHVSDAVFYDPEDAELIKAHIMKYGAVMVSYYASGLYLPKNGLYQYNPVKTSTNHALTIVGWDDNISKENFKTKNGQVPEHDGAWLIKNSWGSGIGEDGYQWYSYDDKTMGSIVGVVVEPAEEKDHIYYYDGSTVLSATHPSKYKSTNDYYFYNIYENTTNRPQDITGAGVGVKLYATDAAGNVVSEIESTVGQVQVFRNPTPGQALSGEPLLSEPVKKTITKSGYYTFDLDEEMLIYPGDTFSIVFSFDKDVYVYIDKNYKISWVYYYTGETNGMQRSYLNGTDLSGSEGTVAKTLRIKAYTKDVKTDAFVKAIDTTISAGNPIPDLQYEVLGLREGDGLIHEPKLTVSGNAALPGTYPIKVTVSSNDAGPGYNLKGIDGILTVTESEHDYIVSFDALGICDNPPSQTVSYNGHATEPIINIPKDYDFLGWYRDKNYTKKWDFDKDSPLGYDVILYAKWEKKESDIIVDPVPIPDPPVPVPDPVPIPNPPVPDPPVPGPIMEEDRGDITDEDYEEYCKEGIPSGIWIAGVPEGEKALCYDGSKKIFDYRVYDYNRRLIQGTDYKARFVRNINACEDIKVSNAPALIIKGIGNYKGSKTVNFVIKRYSLEESLDVFCPDMSLIYSEDAEVVPFVYASGRKLTLGQDYTFNIHNPDGDMAGTYYLSPGSYNIEIVGAGNYTGRREATLNVYAAGDKKDIKKVKIKGFKKKLKYADGAEVIQDKLILRGKDNEELIEGSDYELSYWHNVDPGKATLFINGINDYAGIRNLQYVIKGRSIKNCKVDALYDREEDYPFVYDGQEMTPSVTVLSYNQEEDELTELSEDVDYTVTYKDNIEAGKATVLITGINGYYGSIKRSFIIKKQDITECELSFSEEAPYSKKGAKPIVSLVFDGEELAEGKDYKIICKNNKVYAGSKAPVFMIKGLGNFKGFYKSYDPETDRDIKAIFEYSIIRKSLADGYRPLSMTVEDVVFNTEADLWKSKPVIYDENGKKLKEGRDYKDITYSDAFTGKPLDSTKITKGMCITVSVNGTGFYTDSLSSNYRVVSKLIDKAVVTVDEAVFSKNGAIPNAVKITLDGYTLTEEDYEIVSIDRNLKTGKGKLLLRGLGEYGGTKKVTFKIVQKHIGV